MARTLALFNERRPDPELREKRRRPGSTGLKVPVRGWLKDDERTTVSADIELQLVFGPHPPFDHILGLLLVD